MACARATDVTDRTVWAACAAALAAAGCGGASGPAPLAQVRTVAGEVGTCDFADATGAAARFNVPSGIAVSRAGDLYVADFQNFRVRRVTRAGAVTTLAGGAATAGRLIDGRGAAAGFAYPSAIAIDDEDRLYVYDRCAVRALTLAGEVTTLAGGAAADGTPLCGAVDDPASARARFDDGGSGGGIAVGPDRTVYVADFGNAAIRAIAPGGAVTTVAGGHGVGDRDGGATEAQLAGPSGVAVADDGTLYVADLANNRIRAVAPGGAVRTVAGSGADRSTDGVGRAAELSRPWAVAIARDGSLVVSENHGNLIRQIGADGTVTTLAGAGFAGGKDGPLRDATFYGPAQLAFGPGGELYVADQAGCTVRALTP